MITLIQGGHLYGPEDLGSKDVLVLNGKIEQIADKISLSDEVFRRAEIVQAGGKLVFPASSTSMCIPSAGAAAADL